MSDREIVCGDLSAALDDLRGQGFRLDLIYPADEPHTAALSKGSDSVRLTTRPRAPAPSEALPPFAPEFVLTRGGGSAGTGRAGMLYRDLIPSRLGGRYIVSHISIPEGGLVTDWVHFHRIALQLLYVRRGWVRLVYEDQGETFGMREGDLVLQPPGIRHQVLESSAGFEIVEISAPAVHATYADHDMELPSGREPDRMFGRQRFLHHIAADTPWTRFNGGEAQETAMAAASGGLADVRTIRSARGRSIDFPAHVGELVFGFVLNGSATLMSRCKKALGPADSFVIPPAEPWCLADPSPDLRLLHVTTSRLD